MSATEFSGARDLGNGVYALTPLGRRPDIDPDHLRAGVNRVRQGSAHAIAYGPAGNGRQVLATPASILLINESEFLSLNADVLQDLSGARIGADAVVALMEIQWRLSLSGVKVIAEAGPAPEGMVPASPDERVLRNKGVLSMVDTCTSAPLRGPLMAALELALTSHHLQAAGCDTTVLDLQRSPGNDDVGEVQVPATAMIGAYSIDRALDTLHTGADIRRALHRQARLRNGGTYRALLRQLLPVVHEFLALPEELASGFESDLGVTSLLSSGTRVLALGTEEATGRIAAALSGLDGIEFRSSRPAGLDEGNRSDSAEATVTAVLRSVDRWADVIVLADPFDPECWPYLATHVPIVVDLSAVDLVAALTVERPEGDLPGLLRRLLSRADLVLTANRTHRDLLLGALAGVHRITAEGYDADPSLESLVTASWDEALANFVSWPLRAADAASEPAYRRPPKPSDLALALQYLREGGIRNVVTKAAGRIRRVRNGSKDGSK